MVSRDFQNGFFPASRLFSVRAVLGIALAAFAAAPAMAQDSNRDQVRATVASGGWNVVWGVTLNEAEYAKASLSLYNGTFSAYFDNLLQRNIDKFRANAPGVTASAVSSTIQKAFKDRGKTFRVGKIGVKAGLATYNRWYNTSMQVPDGTERYKIKGPWGTWTYGYRPKFKTVRKQIPLPNHHQPYVAFRLY
jgi:hypothetical protein